MPELARLMTVGDLRRFLREIPDDVSIGIAIPPGTPTSAEMSVLFAARAVYKGGPVLRFAPAEGESVSVVVTDTLSITGRGVAVLLDVYGDWQFGERVRVTIEQSNGETREVPGEVEFVLLAEPHKHERPAVLLREMDAGDVPVGTKLLIKGAG